MKKEKKIPKMWWGKNEKLHKKTPFWPVAIIILALCIDELWIQMTSNTDLLHTQIMFSHFLWNAFVQHSTIYYDTHPHCIITKTRNEKKCYCLAFVVRYVGKFSLHFKWISYYSLVQASFFTLPKIKLILIHQHRLEFIW